MWLMTTYACPVVIVFVTDICFRVCFFDVTIAFLVFFFLRAVGLCVASIFALCSRYRFISLAPFVCFIRPPVIFPCVCTLLWPPVYKLCVVFSIHVCVFEYCAVRRQSYKSSFLRVCGHVAATRCELVHDVANCYLLFKILCCLLSATSNV